MKRRFLGKRIAFVGGGKFCNKLLEFIADEAFPGPRPEVLAIADTDMEAPGIRAARKMGIFTTADYRELYRIAGLEALIEVTYDLSLAETIREEKPEHIDLIDHFEARFIWDSLHVEHVKRKTQWELDERGSDRETVFTLFENLAREVTAVIERRHARYQQIEQELFRQKRTLAQIIEGSTIPTFVIDQEHVITHWNRAMERLTGLRAQEMVGTRKQWMPFYQSERPSMADVILDRIDKATIEKLYGGKWRKSVLVEGAYEADGFFPNLGGDGKWCWFTAAPIEAPDGSFIGAIETVWDKTEEKKAEEEIERHNRLMTETARALGKSEAVMKQIIQGSTIPTFVIDETHTVTHWNRALEVLSGVFSQDIIGTRKQWIPFYRSERPTMADLILDQVDEARIERLYSGHWRRSELIQGAYEAEGFFPNLGGEGKWCWFTAAPIQAPDGTLIGAIETLWDKTEDKRAEEEKERHTRELSTLCSIYTALSATMNIDTALFMTAEELQRFSDADGVCIYLREDDGRYRMRYGTGLSADACKKVRLVDDTSIIAQVAGENRFTLFEDLPEGSSDEIQFLEEQQFVSLAYIPISSKERQNFGVIRLASRQPNQFSHGQKDVFELIGNRIGVAFENAILQERYRKSEEKYRTLFNSDPHPTFILDSATFQILDVNQRAQDSYGYGREELIDLSFLSLGDKDDPEIAQGLDQLEEDQSAMFTKKRHYRKDGEAFFVNINISHARIDENTVIIASTTDISESVEKETQLIQASKMTTLGQMAAGIAHEINQPLNVMQVTADYLKKMLSRGRTLSGEDLDSIAEDFQSNVQRASAIIQHMRDFSRQSDVNRARIDINAPIRDVFKVLGHQLEVHQIELDLDLGKGLPPIYADHNRLEQVFINLVTNAVDAMDTKAAASGNGFDKRLTIRSGFEDGMVTVTVTDTGIGMSKAVQEKIFEPFFTTKEVGKGTGLGVSISYGIVKDYDGSIEVRSSEGEGTTFTLRFPAVR